MALWPNLPVKDIPIGGFRGLDESVPPTARPLGVLSVLSNLVLEPLPSLSTRPGLTVQGSALAAAVSRGSGQYRNLAGTTVQTLSQAGTQLSYWNTGTSAWTSITASAPDKNFTAANLNDLLCLFWSGSTPKKWNGSTLATLGGSPPQGEFVAVSHGKLFVAGIPTREGDVDFCDDEDPETWSPASSNTAGSITMSTEPIKWLGYSQEMDKVIVWTARETIVLYGPETPDNPALWEFKVANPHGTPNGRTVQNLSGVWIWLTHSGDRKGFALWSGGQAEVVEDPIATSLALIDWANISKACSWIDSAGRYHCQCPKSSGFLEFVFDPDTRVWSTGASKDIRQSGVLTLNGEDFHLLGDVNGQQYLATGTNDAGTAIAYEAVLGPSPFGDSFAQGRQITGITLLLSAQAGAAVNAAVSTSESGSYGTTKSLSVSTSFSRVRFPVPIAPGDAKTGGVFRVRIWGTGVITLHDILITTYQGAR